MDMGMQHGHGHSVFTWACSIVALLNAFHSSLYFTFTYSPSNVQARPLMVFTLAFCSAFISNESLQQMVLPWGQCSKENCVKLLVSNDDI